MNPKWKEKQIGYHCALKISSNVSHEQQQQRLVKKSIKITVWYRKYNNIKITRKEAKKEK